MYNPQHQYANAHAGISEQASSKSVTINSAKSPAQRPSEFARMVLEQSEELNGQLRQLRFRLFGESEPEPGNAAQQSEMSIEATIQAAHFALGCAINQLTGIHNRL